MMAGERRHVIGGVGGGVVIMVIEGGFGVMFDLNIKLLMGFGQEFDLSAHLTDRRMFAFLELKIALVRLHLTKRLPKRKSP